MRAGVRALFAAAAAAYDRGNPLLAAERPETAALLPPLAGRTVLDLGAGRGHWARAASDRGAARAVALDLSREMLEGAPRPAVVGDACRLPLRDGWADLVVASLVVSWVPDPAACFREAARVLVRGGTLVASDLHPVASERGWRRTFTGPDGGAVAAPAAPHAVSDLRRWMRGAGFVLEVLREPVIGASLEPHFRAAGRRDFPDLAGTPLLVVWRARKEGR